MNIIPANLLQNNKEETLIDATSRIRELYNKFEQYQEKRGNVEDAFSMLRGDILDEKQLGIYPLHEDRNISIFLYRIKLQGDELFVMLDYMINPTNNLFKDEEQEELIKQQLKYVKIENSVKLNVENIENYKKSLENRVRKMIQADNSGYGLYTEGETNISKALCNITTRDSTHIIYLESLIFRLEDNDQYAQDIKRVYKNRGDIYVIVLSNGSEVKLKILRGLKGLDDGLHIFGLLDDTETIVKYESIVQEQVVDKYQKAFEKESKTYKTATIKQKLFTVLSFGFYKPKLEEEENNEEVIYDGKLLEGELGIRDIEDFYKKNMALVSMELGVDMGTSNLELWDFSKLVLNDIRTKVEIFLDEGKLIGRIFIVQKLIESWEEIRNQNISKLVEYIIKYKLLEGKELKDFLEKISEVEDLDVDSIVGERIYLDSLVQPSEDLPYSLSVGEETICVHSPNKGILTCDRETKEQEMLMISGNSAEFSLNMRYVLLVEEDKDAKESYNIYDLEKRETIRDFQVLSQGYAWHENVMTNKYFLQVSRDSLFIEFIDKANKNETDLYLDMFAVSKDKNSRFIFLVKDKKITYYDTYYAKFHDLFELGKKDIIFDIICTESGVNIIYADFESSQITIRFIRIENGEIGDSVYYKFKKDFQPFQNKIKIAPDNKHLLAIKKEEDISHIKLFDIVDSSIVPVVTIAKIDKSIDAISFSYPNEITYIVDNHVHIMNIDTLRILGKKKNSWEDEMMGKSLTSGKSKKTRRIPNYSRLPTTIGTIIRKPKSKRTTNPYLQSSTHIGKKGALAQIRKKNKLKRGKKTKRIGSNALINKLIDLGLRNSDNGSINEIMEKKMEEMDIKRSDIEKRMEEINRKKKKKMRDFEKERIDIERGMGKKMRKIYKRIDKKKLNF